MKTFLNQLKWQFLLLHKNNILSISIGVTVIYAVLLYFLKSIGNVDKLLVSLVLNDPSVIGYFFIALAIYTEIKHQVLPAIFVSPVNVHVLLMSKILSISILGLFCSLGLAISISGFGFHIFPYAVGSLGICLLSASLGVFMLTFAQDFLKFAMLSVPVFLVFINMPLAQYLGAFDLSFVMYIFPIQGCLDLIDYAVSESTINFIYAYGSIIFMVPLFYALAYYRFNSKIVHQ